MRDSEIFEDGVSFFEKLKHVFIPKKINSSSQKTLIRHPSSTFSHIEAVKCGKLKTFTTHMVTTGDNNLIKSLYYISKRLSQSH